VVGGGGAVEAPPPHGFSVIFSGVELAYLHSARPSQLFSASFGILLTILALIVSTQLQQKNTIEIIL